MNSSSVVAYLSEHMGLPIENQLFNQRYYQPRGKGFVAFSIHTNHGPESEVWVSIQLNEDLAQKLTTPMMHGGDPTQNEIYAHVRANPNPEQPLEVWLTRTAGLEMKDGSGDPVGLPIMPESFFKRIRAMKLRPEPKR